MRFLTKPKLTAGSPSPGYQAFSEDSDGTVSWRDPHKGAWAAFTAYTVGDIVENDGSSYVCIQGHNSAGGDEPGVGVSWATYWNLLAAKGDTGAAGTNGTDGDSINWDGAWASGRSYAVDDAVENDGSSYICVAGHSSAASNEPGVGGSWTSVWDLIAAKGDTGSTGPTGPTGPAGSDGADGDPVNWRSAWATSTAYAILDAVENDGSSYICILGHTSSASDEPGVGGSWTTYWDLMAEKGDVGATGATGPAGSDGADGADGIPFWYESIFADFEPSGLDSDEYAYPAFGGNHNWRASTVTAAPAALSSTTDFFDSKGEFTAVPAPFAGKVDKITVTNMKDSTGSGSCTVRVVKAAGNDPFDATGAGSNVTLATKTVTSLARLSSSSSTYSSGNTFNENDFLWIIVEQSDSSTQSVPWRISIKYEITTA